MSSNVNSYSAVLARRWPVMLPAILLVPAVALLLSLGQAKRYSASSQVLLSYDNPVASLNGLSLGGATVAPDRIVSTQAAVARDPVVIQKALALSHVRSTPQAFLARSSVSTLTNADLLQFSVRDSHAATAARLATNYALAYIMYRRQLDSRALDAAIADVSERLSQLSRTGQVATPTYRALQHEQQVLSATQAAGSNDAQLVQPADRGSQVTPRPTRNAAIGLGIGIVLALGLAFLMEALDRPLDSVEEMERRLRLPLLARIPAPGPWRVGLSRLGRLRSFVRERRRRLRVALLAPTPVDPRRPRALVSSSRHLATPGGSRRGAMPLRHPPPSRAARFRRRMARLVRRGAASSTWAASSRWAGFRRRLALLRTSTSASLGPARGAETLVALRDPDGRQAEAFRVLTSSLEFASLEHDFKSIAITSGCGYRGKATTIANLAVTLALAGRRVVVCDLDGQRPAIADLFVLEGHPGATDVILGRAGLDDAIASIPLPAPVSWRRNGDGEETLEEVTVAGTPFLTDAGARLGVLPFGSALLPNSGFLGSRAVMDLVQDLKNADLDLLLIDTPPLLSSGDARTLSARADAVIVALASPVRASVVEELARTLSRSPALPLGFITVGTFPDAGYDARPQRHDLEQLSRSGVGHDGRRVVRRTSSTRH